MHSEQNTLAEIEVTLSEYRNEMSVLRKKILDLETECIGLLLQKEKLEEDNRIKCLKKGLLSDGTPE